MIWFFRSGEWYGSFDPEERGLRFRGGWLSFTPMKEVVILFNEGCYFRSRGNYWKCLVDHLWGHWICKDMLAKIKAWPGCQTHVLRFCAHWPYLDWICNISVTLFPAPCRRGDHPKCLLLHHASLRYEAWVVPPWTTGPCSSYMVVSPPLCFHV